MRNNSRSVKTISTLLSVLIVLTNWMTVFARPLNAAENSSITNYSHNVTQPDTAGAATALAPGSPKADEQARGRAADAYGKLPLRFEANQGQTDPRVKFISRGREYVLFLTPTESVLMLDGPATINPSSPGKNGPTAKRQRAAVRIKFAGADPMAQVEGLDELPGKTNYFLGKDASRWRANIASYARVQYRGIYPGIDLVYYGNQNHIEYDFVVAPGADYKKIHLEVEGAKQTRVDSNGDLVLTTAVGEVRQRKPFAYQEVEGVKREIAARYVISKNRQVDFEVGAYDATKPLVIDPVLDYSTYLGGNNTDEGHDIAIDGSGNAYIVGSTVSFNFPVTITAFDTTYANSFDVFVTKLNATGSELVYSTYLGGNGTDNGLGISVDAAGNAYVTGSTESSEYPTTAGAFQTMFAGGFSPGDAFVTKLNSTGTALIYSTFIGGGSSDQGSDIAVDASGNAYMTGFSSSTNYPTTMGAFQTTFGGGGFDFGDAVITKLNPAGSALVYSTYLGGTAEDQGTGIVVDAAGSAVISGSTNSPNFDVTMGAFQTTFGGSSDQFFGIGDAFVTKLNATGSALDYSTYLGGSADDIARGIALNASGEAFITGMTGSSNFPVTAGVIRVVNGRVARSVDAAGSWAAANAGITDSTILSFAIDPITPSTVFAGTQNGGIFKSTNGGGSWSPTNSGLTNLTIRSIAIDRVTPSTIYLGTNERGVFKSTNGGANWNAINTGQGGNSVNALAIDPLNTSTIYAGTEDGAFKTTNGGASWTAINTGLNAIFIHSLAIDPVNTSNVYAGTFGGVFITRSGGQNWTQSSLASGTIRALQIDPLAPANIYAGGSGGVSKSTDMGVTWNTVNAGLLNRTVNALAINPANASIIYAGTAGGVFKSTNGGSTWLSANTGLAGSVINALAIDPVTPATLYAGTAFGSTDAFVSKLNSAGSALSYSTYLGGSEFDNGNGIAIDSSGNAFLTGETDSDNFPVTPGTFQSPASGFDREAYVTKLNPAGSALIYSTYLGGTRGDDGFSITANASGNAYVTGRTGSSDFPITPGAFQTILGGSPNSFSTDAFVAKINSAPSLTTDLRLSMTGPAGTIMPGSFVDYDITVTNDGPDLAFSVVLTVELSPSLDFNFCNSSFSSCSAMGNTVTFSLNRLASGASVSGTVFANGTCTMPDGVTVTTTASVESQTPEPDLTDNAATVSNPGANSGVMISPTSQAFPSSGGSGTVNVTTNSNCEWTAISNVPWITITSSSTCCNGIVNYTVAANSGPPRVGTITAAGQTFTVTQAGITASAETIGVYLGIERTFYLRNSNTQGNADLTIQYGPANAIPIVGDWDGNGTTTIGVYDPNDQTFYLRNSNTVGPADITFQYGPPNAIPVVGDWDGNGTTTIGVYDPSDRTFYLRNNNSAGFADLTIQYGPSGVVPVVGDWDGNGTTTIGVYETSTRTFYLRNSNTLGNADIQIQYGPSGVIPVVGDWDGNGTTTIGVYEISTRIFYLRNSNTLGNADLTIQYGPSGAIPLAGDWDGI